MLDYSNNVMSGINARYDLRAIEGEKRFRAAFPEMQAILPKNFDSLVFENELGVFDVDLETFKAMNLAKHREKHCTSADAVLRVYPEDIAATLATFATVVPVTDEIRFTGVKTHLKHAHDGGGWTPLVYFETDQRASNRIDGYAVTVIAVLAWRYNEAALRALIAAANGRLERLRVKGLETEIEGLRSQLAMARDALKDAQAEFEERSDALNQVNEQLNALQSLIKKVYYMNGAGGPGSRKAVREAIEASGVRL